MPKSLISLALSLFLGVIILTSCKSNTNPKTNDTVSKTCIYSDGNGNSYVIKNMPSYSFEYRGISPKESSSGTYSGGKPVNKSLEIQDFEKIKGLMQELLADTSIRVKTRMMGTGFIKIQTGDENVFEYVNPKTEGVQKLETLLIGYRD